jgi:hypothetical protein
MTADETKTTDSTGSTGSTRPTRFDKNSYVLPYLIIGGTIGGTLSYLARTPTFFIIGMGIGIGSGMIRDRNIRNNVNIANTGLKAITVYKLGIPIIVIVSAIGIALCVKR